MYILYAQYFLIKSWVLTEIRPHFSFASPDVTMQANPSYTAVEEGVTLEPNPCYSAIQATSTYESINGNGEDQKIVVHICIYIVCLLTSILSVAMSLCTNCTKCPVLNCHAGVTCKMWLYTYVCWTMPFSQYHYCLQVLDLARKKQYTRILTLFSTLSKCFIEWW